MSFRMVLPALSEPHLISGRKIWKWLGSCKGFSERFRVPNTNVLGMFLRLVNCDRSSGKEENLNDDKSMMEIKIQYSCMTQKRNAATWSILGLLATEEPYVWWVSSPRRCLARQRRVPVFELRDHLWLGVYLMQWVPRTKRWSSVFSDGRTFTFARLSD